MEERLVPLRCWPTLVGSEIALIHYGAYHGDDLQCWPILIGNDTTATETCNATRRGFNVVRF
jgi:hypothetical protein